MKKGKKTMMVTIGIACFALSCVTFMQFNGEIKTIKNKECFFSYRNSIFFKMKVIILKY